MRKRKILETLREAGQPLSVDELSEKIGAPVPMLRVDLFRLMGEGKVESRERGNELRWAIKVGKPIEERYEKLAKKQHS